MRGRDIYGATDGPRQHVGSREEALGAVRRVYPTARLEASTGMQATFWVGDYPVGSCWERWDGSWYVRVRP